MFNNFLAGTKWYLFLFDSPMNTVRTLSIWFTAVIIIAFIVCSIVFKNKEQKIVLELLGQFAIGYAILLSVIFLVLNLTENKNEGNFNAMLFFPISALILSVITAAILLILNKKKSKIIKYIAIALVACAFIIVIIFMAVQFLQDDDQSVKSFALYASAILFTALVVFVAFIFDKHPNNFDTKSITYAAVCIAMSFALSYMRIVKMPQNGSITIASLLPLMLYSYIFGTKKGIFAGFIYGLLQALQDPFIIHPAQFLLDYPLAFGSIGLAGIFASNESIKLPQLKFAFGGLIAGLSRFIMHYLSGVFAFGMYAPSGQSPYLYSLIYQAGYVLPDLAVVIFAGIMLMSSKPFVKFIESKMK